MCTAMYWVCNGCICQPVWKQFLCNGVKIKTPDVPPIWTLPTYPQNLCDKRGNWAQYIRKFAKISQAFQVPLKGSPSKRSFTHGVRTDASSSSLRWWTGLCPERGRGGRWPVELSVAVLGRADTIPWVQLAAVPTILDVLSLCIYCTRPIWEKKTEKHTSTISTWLLLRVCHDNINQTFRQLGTVAANALYADTSFKKSCFWNHSRQKRPVAEQMCCCSIRRFPATFLLVLHYWHPFMWRSLRSLRVSEQTVSPPLKLTVFNLSLGRAPGQHAYCCPSAWRQNQGHLLGNGEFHLKAFGCTGTVNSRP